MAGLTRTLDRHFPGYRKRKRRWVQRRRLRRCGIVIIAQAKSGRTWLNAMLSHVMHQVHGVDQHALIGNAAVEHRHPELPRILFTHDSDALWSRPLATAEEYRGKKVVLLVRDPRDTAVSLYFHRARKLGDPARRSRPHTHDLIERVRRINLPHALMFLQRWVLEADRVDALHIVRYEDLRRRPFAELRRLLSFLEIDVDDGVVQRAVDFTSFDNLKALEAAGVFVSAKLRTPDPRNPDAFKVRRGKVGGYRDYLSDEQIGVLDRMVDDAKLERFGYCGDVNDEASTAA